MFRLGKFRSQAEVLNKHYCKPEGIDRVCVCGGGGRDKVYEVVMFRRFGLKEGWNDEARPKPTRRNLNPWLI